MKRAARRPWSVLVVQQYYYPDISAVSQLLGDLLPLLAEGSEYRITVLCGTDSRGEETHRPGRKDGVRILRIPTSFPSSLRGFRVILQALVFHLGTVLYILFGRRYDFVIALTTPPLIGFTVSMALTLRRSRLLHYVEDLYPELLLDARVIRRSEIAKKVTLFNRITLRRAQKVVVIGKYMKEKLSANYGVLGSNCDIVENWTAGVTFNAPQIGDPFVLMYSGNLGFAHDFALFEDFVKALRSLPVRYDFIGAGRRFNYIRRVFRTCGEPRVDVSGYLARSAHAERLTEANAFILAQSADTVGDILPSKFYSYLAAGRPIIFFGPQRSEIGELILANRVGAVVEIDTDVGDACALLQSYLDDPELYMQSCARAAAAYRRNGGVERAAVAFRGLLDGLRNGRGQST